MAQNYKMFSYSQKNGFTLIELMLTVAIVGVLAVVAMPMYASYRVKARSVEGKILLSNIHKVQESWFASYDTYSSCLSDMGIDIPTNRYFSFGFTNHASYGPNSPNDVAITNGAPTSCNSNTAPTTHFFPGSKAIGALSAPTVGDALTDMGTHRVNMNGISYMALAYGHIGNLFASKVEKFLFIDMAYAGLGDAAMTYGLYSINGKGTHVSKLGPNSGPTGIAHVDALIAYIDWCMSVGGNNPNLGIPNCTL